MEPKYDENGFLIQVREKFAYGRDVVLTKYNGAPFLHVYDNSKCWDSNTRVYDKSKGKCISLSWQNATKLCQAINQLDGFVKQIQIEEVRHLVTLWFV